MSTHAMSTRQPRVEASPRAIALRTRGHSHGPITRLVSPGDIGRLIKPFVFLDYFEADPANAPKFGFHPHSGIATLTLILSGQARPSPKRPTIVDNQPATARSRIMMMLPECGIQPPGRLASTSPGGYSILPDQVA